MSYALIDDNPGLFEVINLDDYQKIKADKDLPTLHGKINWDHPDIIRWDDLVHDIEQLRSGKPVTIKVWSHRSNPDYYRHKTTIPRTVLPKPVLIVEGYLALFDKELNKCYARKYYLDTDSRTRMTRRKNASGGKNNIIGDDTYEEDVLLPMHRQFVEPTKENADVVIDVSVKSIDEVAAIVRDDLK